MFEPQTRKAIAMLLAHKKASKEKEDEEEEQREVG